MQFRFSFLLGCLLATTLVCASNGPTLASYQGANPSGILSCALPPPSNFHVVEQGPTSVTFGFIPSMDGASSRIKTYRASDGFLLDDRIIPSGLTKAMIDNLPVNTDVYATINSICENGGDGPISARLDIISLILELIVVGYEPGTERTCTILAPLNACPFFANGNMTTFKVSNNSESREFGVRYLSNYLQVSLPKGMNSDQKFKFYCNVAVEPACTMAELITVTYETNTGPVTVAKFDLLKEYSSTVGYLRCLWLESGYKFERMGPGPTGGGGQRPDDPITGRTQARDDFSISTGVWVFVAPNPFTDILNVYLGDKITSQIHLQLYNLAGQKVLDQQSIGGQEQYALATADLSPGFYLLRIESDGEVQTLKVVKSE